jgi:hypothetical protein
VLGGPGQHHLSVAGGGLQAARHRRHCHWSHWRRRHLSGATRGGYRWRRKHRARIATSAAGERQYEQQAEHRPDSPDNRPTSPVSGRPAGTAGQIHNEIVMSKDVLMVNLTGRC